MRTTATRLVRSICRPTSSTSRAAVVLLNGCRLCLSRMCTGVSTVATTRRSLSCRIGTEVLRIVDEEGLQENARVTGNYLLQGLRDLQHRHEVIGDVRGAGLFVGVDLVTDRETRMPATTIADYVKNRMREKRILIGTEGPAGNILKIRPPLTIARDDVDQLLAALDGVLSETAANI